MARASPSWAMTANSLACAFPSAASVATIAMVVFSPGRPLATGLSAAGGMKAGKPRPPTSPFTSNPAADIDAAAGIDGDQRADGMAIARHRRGGAEPAFEVDRGGPEACPRSPEREASPGGCGSGVAQIAIRRKAPPVLVAAVEQVEQ